MPGKRVTLSQIAKKAGVAKSTVSYALRENPALPKETRLRIQRIARQLGYRPDPLLSQLMSHLHSAPSKRHTGSLAFLNLGDEQDFRRFQPSLKNFYEGAARRADELGYHLSDFWYHEPGMPSKRLAQILASRGIQGILVGSTSHSNSRIVFPWEKFSSITVGYSVVDPPLNRVSTHHYRNVRLGIRQAAGAGCQRLGFIINNAQDAYMDNLCRAAVLDYHAHLPRKRQVPPLILTGNNPQSIARMAPWFKKHAPDVLLCAGLCLEQVEQAGVRIPRDVAGIELLMPYSNPEIAGVHIRYDLLGILAINQLVSQLHHDEFGLPEVPKVVLIEGCWHPGNSFPFAGAPGSKKPA